jgi:hypothetical protein
MHNSLTPCLLTSTVKPLLLLAQLCFPAFSTSIISPLLAADSTMVPRPSIVQVRNLDLAPATRSSPSIWESPQSHDAVRKICCSAYKEALEPPGGSLKLCLGVAVMFSLSRNRLVYMDEVGVREGETLSTERKMAQALILCS